jgi:hypothetical protein
MKKNDLWSWLVYALMVLIIVVVGWFIVRPILNNENTVLPINAIALVLLSVAVGIIVNAFVMELGHLTGASMGNYAIASWIVLGFGFKRDRKGKMQFVFASFDGLTGETRIVPKDVQKSNAKHYIYLPLVYFLLEVIICVGFIVVSSSMISDGDYSWSWVKIAAIIDLAVGGVIFFYDIFPVRLDSMNDGCRLAILNNPANKLAYNQMLITQDKIERGEPLDDTPVYDQVTDFTAEINNAAIYRKLASSDFDGALSVIEKTIASKSLVSLGVYQDAIAQKVSILLLTKPLSGAKDFFINLPLEDKKYIAQLTTMPSIRAYLLASALIEESYSESLVALSKVESLRKKINEQQTPVEEKLLKLSVQKIKDIHADWDFSQYEPLSDSKGNGNSQSDEEEKK